MLDKVLAILKTPINFKLKVEQPNFMASAYYHTFRDKELNPYGEVVLQDLCEYCQVFDVHSGADSEKLRHAMGLKDAFMHIIAKIDEYEHTLQQDDYTTVDSGEE